MGAVVTPDQAAAALTPGLEAWERDALPNYISLGAGVQSTTLALMAARGELGPMPAGAIFADTQWEPAAVYKHLDWLETQLPFPLHRVTAGNLRETIASKRPVGKFRRVDIPAFVAVDGKVAGLINRSCTRDYKIVPIQRKLKELCGITRKRAPKAPVVVSWIGISADEQRRRKPSRDAWVENRWPLLERGISRAGCLQWLHANGFPRPPKSSCIGCPFHNTEQWAALTPAEREDANQIDERLRAHPPGEYRTKGGLFLHRSGRPLREIDFGDEDEGPDEFVWRECEGQCGV